MPINEASPTAVKDTLNESKTILNISRSKEKIN